MAALLYRAPDLGVESERRRQDRLENAPQWIGGSMDRQISGSCRCQTHLFLSIEGLYRLWPSTPMSLGGQERQRRAKKTCPHVQLQRRAEKKVEEEKAETIEA